MKRLVTLLSLSAFLFSCEKDINFDLKNADDLLVVDASIENDKAPVVVLMKSLNFFSTIDPELLANSFVHNAEITVSNGTLTHKLKEYFYPVSSNYNIYVYSIDSSDLATAFKGELNKSYSLKILSEGKEYTATTTVPAILKKPDSLWWKPAQFVEDTNKVVLMIRSTDPPGLGNYVRYFTSKNSQPYLPGRNSVFDDQVIDGSTYSLEVEPGVDLNNPVDFEDNYFVRGDTVTMKLCNIDKPTYTFWSTWEFAYQSIGNPFSQPNKVIGNISNGALGAFYGYGAFYKTIVIPK